MRAATIWTKAFVTDLCLECSNLPSNLILLKTDSIKARLSNNTLTPTVFKDLILTTDLTKVYHHGFDN
jgi:hypothetical protein